MQNNPTINQSALHGIKKYCKNRCRRKRKPCNGCRYSITHVLKRNGFADCIFADTPDSWT